MGQLEQSEQQRLRWNYSPRWKAGRRGARVLTPGRRPAEVELRGAARSSVSPARFLPNWLQPGRSEWSLEVCPEPQPQGDRGPRQTLATAHTQPGKGGLGLLAPPASQFQEKAGVSQALTLPGHNQKAKAPTVPK